MPGATLCQPLCKILEQQGRPAPASSRTTSRTSMFSENSPAFLRTCHACPSVYVYHCSAPRFPILTTKAQQQQQKQCKTGAKLDTTSNINNATTGHEKATPPTQHSWLPAAIDNEQITPTASAHHQQLKTMEHQQEHRRTMIKNSNNSTNTNTGNGTTAAAAAPTPTIQDCKTPAASRLQLLCDLPLV